MYNKVILAMAAAAVSVGLLGWLQKDEPLTAQTKQLLLQDAAYQVPLAKHPYFLLLGIDSRATVEPNTLGRYRYHYDWWQLQQDYLTEKNAQGTALDQRATQDDWPMADQQYLDELLQLVRYHPEQIQDYLNYQKTALAVLPQRHLLSLKRYQNWLAQSDYHVLVMPINSESPDYALLVQLHMLHILQIALQAEGQQLAAYQNYIQQLLQRLNLPLASTERYLLQRFIMDTIDVLRQAQKDTKQTLQLPTLQAEQLSIRPSLAYELTYFQQILRFMRAENPIVNWHLPFFILQQQSLNQWVAQMQPIIQRSELSYVQLQKALARPVVVKQNKWVIKNSIGYVLTQAAQRDWDAFIVRNRLLDQKIMLFNALNQPNKTLKQLNENSQGYQFYQTEQALCIAHPHPQPKQLAEHLQQASCVLK